MQLFSKKSLNSLWGCGFLPIMGALDHLTNPPWVSRSLKYICNMQVDEKIVSHLAHLSRLNVAPEKMGKLVADMQDLVGFVEQLNNLDTTGTEPLMHMGSNVNVLREDIVAGSITREEALKNAPNTDGVFFKVPKVIRK